MQRRRNISQASLQPDERIVRQARAWLLTSVAPYRWEGTLAATSHRVLFAPDVPNELLGDVRLWLGDVIEVNAPARARLHVATSEQSVLIDLPGTVAFIAASGRRWRNRIDRLARSARSPQVDASVRRRAG